MTCTAKIYAPRLMQRQLIKAHKGVIGSACVGCKETCPRAVPDGTDIKPIDMAMNIVCPEDQIEAKED